MSEVDDDATADVPGALRRVAVVDPTGEASFIIALRFESSSAPALTVDPRGALGDAVCQEYQEQYLARGSSTEPSERQALAAMDSLLADYEKRGWTVHEADGDLDFTFQVNLSRGTVVGTVGAVHPLANANADLVEAIQQAVSRALTGPSPEYLDAVNAALEMGEHAAAFAIASEDGALQFAVAMRHPSVLELLKRIDASALPPAQAAELRQARMHLCMVFDQHVDALDDARWLVDHGEGEQIDDASLALAQSLLTLGRVSAARERYKAVLERKNPAKPLVRAFAHRGMALLGDVDEERQIHSDAAATAFLEGGDRRNAATDAVRVVHMLMYHDPEQALLRLDEVASWFGSPGEDPQSRLDVGELFLLRANVLLRINRLADALPLAREAASSLRALLGAEGRYFEAICVYRELLVRTGRADESVGLAEEAKGIARKLGSAAATLALREIIEAGRFDAVAQMEALASALSPERRWLLPLLKALNPALAYEDALELIDVARSDVPSLSKEQTASDVALVDEALAEVSRVHERMNEAEAAYARVLAVQPDHPIANQNRIAILFQQRRWKEALELARSRRARKGELPGILFAEGKAAAELGLWQESAAALARAVRVLSPGDPRERAIRSLLDEVIPNLDGSAKIDTAVPKPAAVTIGRADIDAALAEFARAVGAEMRMRFWSGSGDNRKWASGPEGVGQQLLHAFLKGHFGDSVEVLEEVGVGAGRMDLYLRFSGGLAIVIELKMCGAPYTLGYAEGGLDQLAHYMKQKGTALGYLVVFDARARDYGKGLDAKPLRTDVVLSATFVDVRPTIA